MKKLLFIVLSVFILLGLGSIVLTKNSDKNLPQNTFASLKIGNEESLQLFDISDYVGKTALEATQAKAEVVANGTGVNAFVTSINGREADTKKREFWEFLVNGTQAEVGAGSYTIKDHDEIHWKISNY